MCPAQESAQVDAGGSQQQADVQQARYRETLLALRDTLNTVRASMALVRRQLATAGPETITSWISSLNTACRSSTAALESAEPTFPTRAPDRVGVAARAFRETMERLETALRVHCTEGLSPDGPGEWTDSLRAWAPYRIGQIERQMSEYDWGASRFAKAAGFKLEPKIKP